MDYDEEVKESFYDFADYISCDMADKELLEAIRLE